MTEDAPHWRDTMRPTVGRYIVPPILAVFVPSKTTFFVAITVSAVLFFLEQRDWTLAIALRKLRSWLAGPNRPAITPRRPRRLLDRYEAP
jgi:hypothetical protein